MSKQSSSSRKRKRKSSNTYERRLLEVNQEDGVFLFGLILFVDVVSRIQNDDDTDDNPLDYRIASNEPADARDLDEESRDLSKSTCDEKNERRDTTSRTQ